MADKAVGPARCPFCGRPGQIKKIVGKIGEKSSEVASIAKLADGYDNYKIGFKLSK